ncbi:unnamed protein product [Clonostachys rosea]|uniref:Uncharacterized protein n=1 Tax=Bionectria ochroleuca TaxID=29856 RepID=A0ABY6TZQ4_BIOOC|nr:unnamed protein product [Clonostachys rosea]
MDIKKNWYYPPDFSFFPDGHLRLGTILKSPDDPTQKLANLDPNSYPEVTLPEVKTFERTRPAQSSSKDGDFAWKAFLGIANIPLIGLSKDTTQSGKEPLGPISLEGRVFNDSFSGPSLEAIVNIKAVKEFIDSAVVGKNTIYIITGLLVNQEKTELSYDGSQKRSDKYKLLAGIGNEQSPATLEGGLENSQSPRPQTHELDKGMIYGFRVHAIRYGNPKRYGLHTDQGNFCTGNTEEAGELEYVEATPNVLRSGSYPCRRVDPIPLDDSEDGPVCYNFRKNH